MAQPFDCLCGKLACRGRISGAQDMTDAQLEGVWLNGHIRELLAERKKENATTVGVKTNGPNGVNGSIPTEVEKVSGNGAPAPVEAPVPVVNGNTNGTSSHHVDTVPEEISHKELEGQTAKALEDAVLQAEKVLEAARHALFTYIRQTGSAAGAKSGAGVQRRGPTSRELSGEMGGDTTVIVA